MAFRLPRFRTAVRCLPFALIALVAVACAPENYPQTTLLPKGDFARMVDGLFRTTLWWAVAVFVLVEGALLWVIFKFRGKPDDPEPKQTHGNTVAEIIWTIIPAMILAFIAVPTVKTIFKTYEVPKNNPIQIEVIGHQWWWEFRYPQYGITTANELHVPAGRPVALRMKTEDVLHAFWVPQFAAKRDVFPNRNTVLWFQADSTGLYPGQCAEFCGIQHGKMAFRVMSEDAAAFDAYVKKLQATGAPVAVPVALGNGLTTQTVGATVSIKDTTKQVAVVAAPMTAQDSLVEQGKKLWMSKACIGCHSLNSTKPMGIGPNLAGVGSRAYIAAGTLKNTDENLAHWVRRPQEVKKGVLMQVPDMTEAEAKALVAFLRTNK